MFPLVIFLVILILGYLGTAFVLNRLNNKTYVLTGIEYIFLGIIAGPAFSDFLAYIFKIDYSSLITSELLKQLNPGVAVAIGFVGLFYGLKFRFSDFRSKKPEHFRLLFSEMFFSVLLLGGISFGSLYYFYYSGKNLSELIVASYFLGIAAMLSSNYIIKIITEKFKVEGPIRDSLDFVSRESVNLGILLFGILFGINHIGEKQFVMLTPAEWVLVSIAMPLAAGLIFFIFIGREEDENKLFLAVLGIALFTSGLAYFMNFSPLFSNFILGMILGNFSKVKEKLESSLQRFIHPFTVLIAIAAGFMWMPANYEVFIIAAFGYFILRHLMKLASGYFAFITSYDKSVLSNTVGKGLLHADIIICAVVIDYSMVYNNKLTPIVVSAVMVSLIINSVAGYQSAKKLLLDRGELTGGKE